MNIQTADLNFIPKDIDGNPCSDKTASRECGELLLNQFNTTMVAERYLAGKTLIKTGQLQFDLDIPAHVALKEYLTTEMLSWMQAPFTNNYKGQILEKLNA